MDLKDDDLISMMAAAPKPMEPERDVAYGPESRLEKEYAPHFNAWKANPNPQTATALVNAANPLIDKAVNHLGGSPALRNRAKQLVLGAARTYDPSRASFKTHVNTHLQGLNRIAIQQESPIQVPERLLMDRRALNMAHNTLSDELGREPSDVELANHTGLSLKRITKVRKYKNPVASGFFDIAQSDEDQAVTPAVERDDPMHLLEEFLYHELSPRDQVIYEYATGRNGKPQMGTNEIAKAINVTPGAVSQRLAAIQKKFDAAQELNIFGS